MNQQPVKRKIRLVVLNDGSTDGIKNFLKNNDSKILKYFQAMEASIRASQ